MNSEQRENIKSVMSMLEQCSSIIDNVQTDVAEKTELLPKGSDERNVMGRIDHYLLRAYVQVGNAAESLESSLEV